MDTRVVPSICRNCLAYCPILVTIEGGRAVKVVGDPDAPAFDGYSCPKGRALPAQHNDPLRLLRCMRRGADGRFGAIDSALAMDQIARRVEEMIARHGPRAIALYSGTGQVSHPAGGPIVRAWARAIGTRMNFSASTIDKPAEYTSVALHGNWHAGLQTFETSDTWMIVGANPVIAKSNGAPFNNPGMRLKEAVQRGMKMIVIDPRRTETAKRAHVHLQPRPGQDFVLLAGIIHIVIEEKLYDADFIGANVEGFSALKAAVAEFTPAFVAQRADVPVDRLLVAARTFGSGKRGGVVCSTGPSFATHSNLTYYLALCLNTLCGRWARAGDAAPHSNVLLPAFTPRAQPYAPYPVISDRPMRVHGLWENASGVPTAALADEILLDGEGQIKVLFCLGGNPVLSWPDQKKTEAALKKLDLLVVLDYQMTATAQFAHYVIPPPLSLELPGSTQMVESLKYAGVSRGYPMPWAQYTPAVVAYPPQSDLLDDGAFFFGLAQRMGLQLEWLNVRGQGPNLEGPTQAIPLDMRCAPSVEEMVALACAESRVPLEVVKTHPHGQLYSLDVTVQSRDPACSARLQLGDETMMEELRSVHADIAALIAAAIIYFYTHCVRSTLLVIFCSGVAVLWQVGMVSMFGFEIDPFSVLVPFLVFAIGVSHGAQKMNGIMQDVGRGTHRLVAARYTFRRLFLAGLTALLADAVGFAVLMTIDIPVIKELALAASIGVAVLIFTNLVLLPILLSYIGVSPKAAARSLRAEREEAQGKGMGAIWGFLDRFTERRWALGLIGVSLALAGAGFAVSLSLKIGDLDPGAPELRPESRYNRDNAFITENFALSNDQFAVIVKTPPDGCLDYKTLVEADRLGWQLRQLPGVQTVVSLAESTRRVTAGTYEGSTKWLTIARNQETINFAGNQAMTSNPDLTNKECSVSPVIAYLTDHKAETLDSVVRTVADFAEKHNDQDRQFLLAAGSSGIEAATNIVVKEANHTMLLYVYAAVIALCFVAFRNWRAVLVAIIPLMITSILCEALMVMLGIGVKVATLPVIALGVGIGVDYALYLLSVQLAYQRRGFSLADSYRKAVQFTGRIVALVGFTLGAGVVTWAWSPIKFQADMGILLTFMFVLNMLGALILIPALSHFLLNQKAGATK